MKELYSNKLGMIYRIKEDRIVFEDGVNYRPHETRAIKNIDTGGLKYIHGIKKRFKGIIL